MNIRERLLTIPTVESVETDKNGIYKGRPAYIYKIVTLHPLTGKKFEHEWELVKDRVFTEEAMFVIIQSYLKEWWNNVD
jgi:hypothetical protein